MKKQEMQRLLELVGRLTRGQRRELVDKLKTQSNAEASIEVVESAGSRARACPHCKSERLVRNGMADELQRGLQVGGLSFVPRHDATTV